MVGYPVIWGAIKNLVGFVKMPTNDWASPDPKKLAFHQKGAVLWRRPSRIGISSSRTARNRRTAPTSWASFYFRSFLFLSWLPILPDRPLGSFMDNLGPGQVVGRQALGSSPLGELHVGLSVEQGTGLVVDVREARNLKTSGPKGVPGSRNWVLWR